MRASATQTDSTARMLPQIRVKRHSKRGLVFRDRRPQAARKAGTVNEQMTVPVFRRVDQQCERGSKILSFIP